MLKKFTAALALLCASLSFAASASATDIGANDDTGKYSSDPTTFFSKMAALGMKQNVMTVRWTPGSPAIADKGFLDNAVPAAQAQGIKVLFAVYPYPPSAIEAGAATPEAFASWLGTLASLYPSVGTYIVGNEPNLNTFWRPQGDGTGRIQSAASFGQFLAAGYDALKPRGATVLGVGLSPRGDLAPDRAGKTAPVAWLKALGEWYRSSGRTTPLMDGFSFHPYPNPSDFTVPLTFAYGWPNASVQELPRIKQSLYDAFHGTAQPTTASGLKLYLDEVGWQVDTSSVAGYDDSENVKVTTEAQQAQIYGDLVRLVACDPDVAQLNFFGFYDEKSRLGWQAATHRADGTPRASAEAVKTAIPQGCQGARRTWQPLTGVAGAGAAFAEEGKTHASKKSVWALNPTAEEQYEYAAGVFPADASEAAIEKALAAGKGVVTGLGKANHEPRVEVGGTLADGTYVLAVRLAAWANPKRTTVLVSEPFTVGAGGTTAATGVTVSGQLSTLVGNSRSLVGSLNRLRSVKRLPPLVCNRACVARYTLAFLGRSTAAADGRTAKVYRTTLKLKPKQKGTPRLVLKGLTPGTYRLTVQVASGAAKATISSKPFVLDAKGNVKKLVKKKAARVKAATAK